MQQAIACCMDLFKGALQNYHFSGTFLLKDFHPVAYFPKF
jgi:hypothetical protein